MEAVGLEVTVQQAMRSVGIGGRVTVIGTLAKMMSLDMLDAVVRELDIKGSYGYTPNDFRTALTLITSQKVDVNLWLQTSSRLRGLLKASSYYMRRGKRLEVVLKP